MPSNRENNDDDEKLSYLQISTSEMSEQNRQKPHTVIRATTECGEKKTVKQ